VALLAESWGTGWNSPPPDPMGEDFDYAKEFKSLDLDAVIKDLRALMTDSQDWWPADYGHYGPLFIRMAWHSAGTYRIADGRGGARRRAAALRTAQQLAGQRQPRQGAPPALADQAEVRQQDLLGRPDDPGRQRGAGVDGLQDLRLRRWPRRRLGAGRDVYWGAEDDVAGATSATAATANCENPLAAVQMGLIYVNPEGPERQARPAGRGARHPRDLRPHGDERRGNRRPDRRAATPSARPTAPADAAHTSARSPRRAGIEEQGLGWKNSYGSRQGRATPSPAASKAPGRTNPVQWDNDYLREPVRLRVGADQEPGRRARSGGRRTPPPSIVPDAHDPAKRHAADDDHDRPRRCASTRPTRRSRAASTSNPDEFADAFARAWFKLTHRDMGPSARYLGPRGAGRRPDLAGPDPGGRSPADRRGRTSPRSRRRSCASGLSVPELVSTAWASASTFRGSDKRGGANGARIRLAPQKDWEVNQPGRAGEGAARRWRRSRRDFNARSRAARRSRWPT